MALGTELEGREEERGKREKSMMMMMREMRTGFAIDLCYMQMSNV